nr:copper amine oxidase N-terminal domain-containing protein [Veillonella sp.]
VRNGKLNVINLNLSEDYMPAAQLKNGVMYVSPKTFELLLNDVAVQGNEIYIAPQRSYIMDSGTSVPVSPDQ